MSSYQSFYDALVEAGETFGSFGSNDWNASNRSPVHPSFVTHHPQMGVTSPPMGHPAYHQMAKPVQHFAPDPRLPLAPYNPYSPVHPSAQYQLVAPPPGSYSPRDPRFLPPVPVYPQAAPMPFGTYGYGQTSPVRRAYSRPPAYDFGPSKIPSRSQPAHRRRSYSSSSSDSDAAAEISARILKSSDDPLELKRIMKDTRKRPKSTKPKPKEASPKLSVRNRHSSPIVERRERKSNHRAPKRKSGPEKRRSISPFIVNDEEEIPAARDADYFNDKIDNSPVRRKEKAKPVAKKPRRSQSEIAPAIVPYIPKEHRPRPTQRDQIGERTQEFWNPSTIQTGKRQRLPRLDWRKGERYLRAPDGTIIGKQGYSKLVCDDGFSKPKSQPGKAKTSSRRSQSPIRNSRSRRESVPSTVEERPLLNAFDFLEKDEEGVFCLGKHRLLHRAADRKWGDSIEQGGFRLCPSISTADAYIAEIALEPGKAEERAPETLLANQVIYGRVLQAAPNSVRLQIIGKSDERLSDEDEFYIDAGSTYLITNLSQEKAAVLSLVAFE